MVADAELDVAVFTGHDSYQSIKQRYGFVTPTGVSPNGEVSNSHIVDLAELIEQNGIETVLYDPFEVAQPGEDLPQLVEALFEDSGAERAEPLSPLSGVTQGWAENEWGYVEQREQVDVPSLRPRLTPPEPCVGGRRSAVFQHRAESARVERPGLSTLGGVDVQRGFYDTSDGR